MNNKTTTNAGTYLKGLIEQAGITQKELAQMLGVHKNTFCNWCNGKYKIKTEYITKLIEFFNSNPNVTDFNPVILMEAEEQKPFVDNEKLNCLKQQIVELKRKNARLEKRNAVLEELKLNQDELDEREEELIAWEKELDKEEKAYKKLVLAANLTVNRHYIHTQLNLSRDIENALKSPPFIKKFETVFELNKEEKFNKFKTAIATLVKSGVSEIIAQKVKELCEIEIAKIEKEAEETEE